MTYQQMSDRYREQGLRTRAEMCARQQGYIFAADGRPDIAALGMGVVAGDWVDIDAIIAAICAGENSDALDDDAELMSAVQGVWPTVAAARHPSA